MKEIKPVDLEEDEVENGDTKNLQPSFGLLGLSRFRCKEQNRLLFNWTIFHKWKAVHLDLTRRTPACSFRGKWVWTSRFVYINSTLGLSRLNKRPSPKKANVPNFHRENSSSSKTSSIASLRDTEKTKVSKIFEFQSQNVSILWAFLASLDHQDPDA